MTERNPYTELNVTQRRYVEARLQGLPIVAAAKAAGLEHANSHAHRLERSPKVRKAIKYLIKDSTANVEELTKSDVMTGMLDAVEAAATASELVMAWRELGKLIGAYEPEKKILEIHDYTRDELKTLSEEELLKLSGGKYADVIDGEFEEIRQSHLPAEIEDATSEGV
jgi:phage terminase small subunit